MARLHIRHVHTYITQASVRRPPMIHRWKIRSIVLMSSRITWRHQCSATVCLKINVCMELVSEFKALHFKTPCTTKLNISAVHHWENCLHFLYAGAPAYRMHPTAYRTLSFFTHPTALMHLKKWILRKCIQLHFIFLAPTRMGSHWELL